MKRYFLIVFILLLTTAVLIGCDNQSPQEQSPTPSSTVVQTGEAPDDIVYPPGGPAYRANVHQAGVPDRWPSIQSKDVTLNGPSGIAQISYRDYIETKAGQIRNNIFSVYLPDAQPINGTKAIEFILEAVDAPEGISVTHGDNVYHADPARRTKTVLKIEIGPQVTPGEYTLQIGVEIDGTDYGKVPCIVRVVQDVVTPQPITTIPPPKTDWGKGTSPPEGIGGWQKPRPLTEAEKAKVVEIAVNSPEASAWLQGRIDYRTAPVNWYAIVWSPNGEAGQWWAPEYKIVDEGIPSYVSPYAYWYPGVTIAVGQGTIYQMQIAIDLDADKTAMVDGPYPSLSSPDRIRDLTGNMLSPSPAPTDFTETGSVTVKSRNGLNLSLSLNSTRFLPGQEVSMTIGERNTLETENNVPAASNWPLKGLTLGPCGTINYPMGVAIFQGNYTSSNISSATPFLLYDPQSIYHCPAILASIQAYVFEPLSDLTRVIGSCDPNPCFTDYKIHSEITVKGYWTNDQEAKFSNFTPGVYTVTGGDEWGTLAVLHFVIHFIGFDEGRGLRWQSDETQGVSSEFNILLTYNPRILFAELDKIGFSYVQSTSSGFSVRVEQEYDRTYSNGDALEIWPGSHCRELSLD